MTAPQPSPHRPRRRRLAGLAAGAALLLGTPLAVPSAQADDTGRTYQVAPAGSDTAPGSADQPLRTIGRCLDLVAPGDTCLIHTGTYREQVTPPSGTPGHPVTLAAAGDGPVTVDGTETVTGWQDAGGGLVSTTVDLPLPDDENALFLDHDRAPEGRWPNSGTDPMNPTWEVAATGSTSQRIVDPALPAGDWTGATVHVWAGSNSWAQQTGTVTGTTAGALTFTGGNNRCPYLCMGAYTDRNYYLVGSKAALDQPGEWYYDHAAGTLYLVPPKDGIAGHTVTAKHRTWGLDLGHASYVTVRGLSLWGTSARTGDDTTGDLLDGLTARYVSEYRTLPMPADDELSAPPTEGNIVAARMLDTGIQIRGTGNTLRDSSVALSAGNGVLVRGTGNTVTGNLIQDVGWMGSYTPGIEINGNGHTVTHNTVRRTGRVAVDVARQLNGTEFHDNRIAYNDLSESMISSRDGSPFYVCCSLDGTGSSVDHNAVHDSDGWNAYYIDNSSSYFLLHHNTAWNVGSNGTFFNPNGSYSRGNQDHNSSYGIGISGRAVLMNGGTDASGTYVSNDAALTDISVPGPGNPAPIARANLVAPTDPLYSDPRNGELWLREGSPAVDHGETLAGITDGFRGTAPDQGAYEYGDAIWSPGCHLDGCQDRIRNDGWTATGTDGGSAAAAVDGNLVTAWTDTAKRTPGRTLTLDLGRPTTVGRVVLDAGRDATGQPAGWTLETSTDGTDWTTRATVSGTSFAQQAAFPETTARYLRATLTAGGTTPWTVDEVRLYGDGPDATGTLQAEQAPVLSAGATRGNAAVGPLTNGQYLGIPGVEFGGGTSHLTVRLASTGCGGTDDCILQVRTGSPRGPVAAVLTVPDTGGTDTWHTAALDLPTPLTGRHDLYLVARGGTAASAVSVDWLTFRTTG